MHLVRWLQINGLLWSVLGTYAAGYIAANAFAASMHWWNGLLAGGVVLIVVALATTLLYIIVEFATE